MTLILWDLLSDTTQQIKGIMELPRHPCAYMNKGNFNSETFSDGKYSNIALKNKRSHIFVEVIVIILTLKMNLSNFREE